MGVLQFQQSISFTVIHCYKPECQVLIAMPDALYERLRGKERGTSFYCLHGHSQVFTGPGEVDKLKAQVADQERSLEWERARVKRAEKQVSVFKGKVTRIKNRVGNGVCPCCNRTFQNLMAHMKTRHPAYAKETE